MSLEIELIEFKEHLRNRPGMYLGGLGSKGIINLLRGLVSDCIELTNADIYFLRITIKPDYNYSLSIEASDDIRAFKTTNKKLVHFKNFHLSIGEILSSNFKLTFESKNKAFISFQLDQSVFTENVDYLELSESFLQWSYLNRNSKTLLVDERAKFLNQNYFSFPEGVKYLYSKIVRQALGKPEFEIAFDGKFNGLEYQIFLGYRTDWYPPATTLSFANDVFTSCGGSLIEGVMEGLISGVKKYVKDNNLTHLKVKKKKFVNGLILVVSVRGDDFTYGGSFKETLENEKVKKDAKKLTKQLTLDFISESKDKSDKFLWRFDKNQLTSDMY